MDVLRLAQCVFMSVGLWPGAVAADLAVVYDSGATQPLAPYLAAFGENLSTGPALGLSESQLDAADLSQLLPIRTPALTPGTVTARPLSLPDGVSLPRPFFLIGADPQSLQWFAIHRDRLAQIHAVGMLVNAESVADLEAIAAIAQGLPVLPASATDIAQFLGLAHVPVLVSGRGVEQ